VPDESVTDGEFTAADNLSGHPAVPPVDWPGCLANGFLILVVAVALGLVAWSIATAPR
jgi:hypothetical protein